MIPFSFGIQDFLFWLLCSSARGMLLVSMVILAGFFLGAGFHQDFAAGCGCFHASPCLHHPSRKAA
ncbi:MAG: hypothetical protein A2X49_07360 [Lentisphaerae bacterium GWF2_52_8]|nr:MAG: hypothetical protein A2X49_07360 [Lentisphaerae bacterium GWF2_52_8]